MLVVFTVILIVAAPFGMAESEYDNWRIIPTVVLPVLAIVFLFVLPLDMMMTWVFAKGDINRRERLRRALLIEGLALFALIGAWTPFTLQLLPD